MTLGPQNVLVDIISMVKHAAREQEPLFTAEERVDRAFRQIAAGKTVTPDQEQWLGRLRAHLIENLSIQAIAFEDLPILSRDGEWGRANHALNNEVGEFLKRINEALAG